MDSVLNFVYEPCAVYFEALFFLEIVLLVLWRGFDYGQCAVRVVVWICLGKLCCKFWGIVSFIDSVLYMLWCGFVYGRCAVVFFLRGFFYGELSVWEVACFIYGQCAACVEVWSFLLTKCCMCFA